MTTVSTAPALGEFPTRMLIGGEWRAASDGATLKVINPATEELIAEVPDATERDVHDAVAAARAQFDGGEWSKMNGSARREILVRFAGLLRDRAEQFAAIESANGGKILMEPTVLDLPNSVETLNYYAGWADKIEGRTIPSPGYFGRPTLNYTVRQPIGVVGAIVPWNTPTMISCWKIAPALATGCTMVLKASEESPLTGLLLGQLALEAGLPPGVLNIITGRGEVAGAALVKHDGVDKISFTGSPEVGRIILREAAATFKRVTLELGGKSPQIILGDANIDQALAGCLAGVFFNQGQICAAGTRILVERSIADTFAEKLAAAASGIVVGNPQDPAARMGPLVSRRQLERVANYVALGREEGARVLAGGEGVDGPGFFHKPTIFGGATNTMRIAREEIFGPVAVVIPFDTEDEAIALANDSVYGLAATVWTENIARAHAVAARVQAGSVAINGWSPIAPSLPWGGLKQSGLGRELGWNGIEACTEEKLISVVL